MAGAAKPEHVQVSRTVFAEGGDGGGSDMGMPTGGRGSMVALKRLVYPPAGNAADAVVAANDENEDEDEENKFDDVILARCLVSPSLSFETSHRHGIVYAVRTALRTKESIGVSSRCRRPRHPQIAQLTA